MMFRLIILAIILAVVAAGCGPAATFQPTAVPEERTPESSESVRAKTSTTPTNTAATPLQTRKTPTPTPAPTPEERKPAENSGSNALSGPGASDGNHILAFIPASWLDRGVWISNEGKAVQSAGAPNPGTLEKFLEMSEEEQASFFNAFAKALSPSFVITLRESPGEWKEGLGLDLFSISSSASVGAASRFPLIPVVLLGEINPSEITRKLLNSGYELRSYKGEEYYESETAFKPGGPPPFSIQTNRVFAGSNIVVASPETASIEEFIDILAGEAGSLADNPLAFAAIESLGETFAAAALTRTGVFNPEGAAPLTYAKPPAWGDLAQWSILAAGNGVEDGQPYFAFAIAFDDPGAAESNLDEVIARVENYETLVPQRFPENRALSEGWPNQPFDAACSDVSINARRWPFGSAITVFCQTQISLLWTQLVDLRDLGFLAP